MKHIYLIFASIVLFILLVGCSSPKDASKDNFKKVINAYLDKNCITISPQESPWRGISYHVFPVTIKLLPSDNKGTDEQKAQITQEFDALVGIGMLEVQDGSAKVNKSTADDEKITIPAKIYALSEKGKQLFSKTGFCVATYEVNEISGFSEPSQSMGHARSDVSFLVSPKDIKDWSKKETIIKAFPRLLRKLEQNQAQSARLILMNDGWVHEDEVE